MLSKAAGRSVRSLVGAVEPFNHLFERPEFFRYGIVVGKSKDLGNLKLKFFTELAEELLSGKRIGAVAVGDEAEVFGELFKVAEGHAHRKDAGADTAVEGSAVADDGAFGGIHDEPDVTLHTADLDVGFIGSKRAANVVIIVIDEGFDADGSCFTVVGDLLVGDVDVVEIF